MSDLPNIEKNRIVIEGPTGIDHKIDGNGSSQVRLYDVDGNPFIGQKMMEDSLPVVVASDQTPIPAQHEGCYQTSQLKTYFVAASVNLPSSGTETRVLLIRNPSNSGKVLALSRVMGLLTNTTGSMAIIRKYISPTITATGTAVTIYSMNVGGGASASAMLVYTGPTASAVGNRFCSCLAISGTSGGKEADIDFQGMVYLQPGQDLLITGTPDGTNRGLEIDVMWWEM